MQETFDATTDGVRLAIGVDFTVNLGNYQNMKVSYHISGISLAANVSEILDLADGKLSSVFDGLKKKAMLKVRDAKPRRK